MCASMLQTLSKDKAFGYTLNRAFEGHASLPASVRIHNFHGTYGDYLICVCEPTCNVVAAILIPILDLVLSRASFYMRVLHTHRSMVLHSST